MRKQLIPLLAMTFLSSAAFADGLTVRELSVRSMAQPEPVATLRTAHGAAALAEPSGPTPVTPASAEPFAAFPVAGVIGQDLYIPYYVDLDPGPAASDWNCLWFTFDKHTGDDPYIRSFREQDIGVPVFAALDGVVTFAHGGEPDRNIDINSSTPMNSVVIKHAGGQSTRYDHLRKDVLVQVGQVVSAGTQLGWIGSSGPSAAPHLHFEAQMDGVPYEPFAGNCRPGPSFWVNQPQIAFHTPILLGVSLSSSPFTGTPPEDLANRNSAFVVGNRTMYLQADIGAIPLGVPYVITLERPNGVRMTTTGPLSTRLADMLSARWALDVNLDEAGPWNLLLDVNGVRVARVPFTVYSSFNEVVNKAPNALNAAVDAVRSGEVPVCRAGSGIAPDPDFDTVTYHYEWSVNGSKVRTVDSAARTDVLSRQYSAPGASIICSVTASDGKLQSAASTAFVTVGGDAKRRAVRSR